MSMMTTERPPATRAVVKYDPNGAIGNPGGLRRLLEDQSGNLAQLLPKHVTPERLAKTMLVAANRNPKIYDCTIASVIETITRAAELGLDLSGTLGEAYPVPFNNKLKVNGREVWLHQLQLIIGYRGYEKLAWQSGQVDMIDAEVVHANDAFEFSKGSDGVRLSWSPCMERDRGPVVGAYCIIGIKGGKPLARFLPIADLEKIRNSSKSKDSPAWKNWAGEMYRKCAIKRTMKDSPLSSEKLTRAMELDEADHLDNVLAASTSRRQSGLSLPLDRDAHVMPPDIGESQLDDDELAARSTSVADDSGEPIDDFGGGEDLRPTDGIDGPADDHGDPDDGAFTAADLADWPKADRDMQDRAKDVGLSKLAYQTARKHALGLTPERSTPEDRLAFLNRVLARGFDKEGKPVPAAAS